MINIILIYLNEIVNEPECTDVMFWFECTETGTLKHNAFSSKIVFTKTDGISTSSVSFQPVKITLVSVCFQRKVCGTHFASRVPEIKRALKEMRDHVYHSAQVQSFAGAAPQKDKGAER